MANVHMVVGALVVLAFLVLTVLNFLAVRRGTPSPWARWLSYIAAALLLIQYVLGFSLLGEGHHNKTLHYVLALLPILSVGFEHGFARNQPTQEERSRWSLIANAVTFILVLAAYGVGESGAS